MLIRNLTSKHDLENQRKLQAELLQIQIDNEALLEQRVKDYKNPNKPPPVPPQYKTTAEIQRDSLTQQRESIENLRSIGLDFAVASQVSQDLTKLPDGEANLVKLNKNFPFIKEDVAKRFNPKYLDAQVLIEYLKEYFAELDSSIGINLAGTSSTNYFGRKPMNAVSILPSIEDLTDLRLIVRDIFDLFVLNPAEVRTIDDQLTGLIDLAPSNDELVSIDTFPIIERQRLNKQVERLIKVYKIPTSSFVYDIIKNLDKIAPQGLGAGALGNAQAQGIPVQQPASPQELQHTLAVLKNTLGHIDAKAQDKLLEFKQAIQAEQQKILQAQAGLLNVAPAIPIHQNNPNLIQVQPVQPPANLPNAQALRDHIIADNKEYIRQLTNSLTNTRGRVRLTDPRTAGAYPTQYFNQVPTNDGNPVAGDYSNVVFESKRLAKGGYKPLNPPELLDGTPVDVATLPHPLEQFLLIARIDKGNPIVLNDVNADASALRYTQPQLRQLVRDYEHPLMFQQLDTNPNYDPKHNVADQRIPEQGFGLTNKVIKHFEKDNKEMMKLKKSFNKHLKTEEKADDISSSDEEEKVGKGNRGFMSRKIKLGKGISIPRDEPKYREFGKYIVHYPQLVNDNVLNLKFPSTGSIPSIKPVNIDDNYKQFFIDVLDNGKVNQRHYESLTEPEKSHFVKIARGAKVLGVLQIKPNEDDQETKDIKRLELLFGEINAGNDNDKMIKECKVLIKKYIANGRINKNKGLEMLMELE